jgi:hypothetical protein
LNTTSFDGAESKCALDAAGFIAQLPIGSLRLEAQGLMGETSYETVDWATSMPSLSNSPRFPSPHYNRTPASSQRRPKPMSFNADEVPITA